MRPLLVDNLLNPVVMRHVQLGIAQLLSVVLLKVIALHSFVTFFLFKT